MEAAYEPAGVPLEDIGEGAVTRVVGFVCDRSLKQRLASLGIRMGTEVGVIQRTGGGRAVLGIGFGHLAAGTDVMRSILVVPARPDE